MSSRTNADDQGSGPPRDPAAYRPGIHFAERFENRYDEYDRHLSGDVVEGCIRNGAVRDVDGPRYYFRETFDGVTFRLVVDAEKRVVVTGYPLAINTEAALDSGRWSFDDVESIRRFIAKDPEDDPAAE